MSPLTTATIRSLLTPPAPPCVSIYLPTHRGEPQRREDTIRYGELVRRAGAELKTKHTGAAATDLVRVLESVAADGDLWSNALDGLAVLAAGTDRHVFRLPRAVPELAVVADSFHLKPLLRVTQSADRFHVLGVTRLEASLYEGDRYGLTRVPTAGLLPTWDAAIGSPADRTHEGQDQAGGRAGKAQIAAEQLNWLRAVDRVVLDRVSNPTGLPLVLVGLPDNLSEFRKLTRNPHLVAADVAKDPGSFATLEELRAAAWAAVEPRYLDRLHKLTEGFGTAKAKGTGSSDPAEIGQALVQGRVGLLLADADRVLPGRFDPATGAVSRADLGDPAVDDLIDDLAEQTLKTGGEVVVVPSDKMPCDTGVAAVYRY